MKIPDFKSEEEEFEFWSTVDTTELMDEGERVEIDASGARRAREARKGKPIVPRSMDEAEPQS